MKREKFMNKEQAIQLELLALRIHREGAAKCEEAIRRIQNGDLDHLFHESQPANRQSRSNLAT